MTGKGRSGVLSPVRGGTARRETRRKRNKRRSDARGRPHLPRAVRVLLWRGAAVLGMCAVLLVCADRAFGPIVREFSLVQAKYLAVTTINQACNEELAAYPVSWQQLTEVTRDETGAITAVELNTAAANDLSARLTLAANAALERMSLKKVRIPLGTVLGSNFLAGRGPGIGFYIQPASYVESSFLSSLEGAGFNQTMHNVVLRMSVVVETFAAGYHTSQTVISDMILAQTVIVGDVPDFYTNNTGTGSA